MDRQIEVLKKTTPLYKLQSDDVSALLTPTMCRSGHSWHVPSFSSLKSWRWSLKSFGLFVVTCRCAIKRQGDSRPFEWKSTVIKDFHLDWQSIGTWQKYLQSNHARLCRRFPYLVYHRRQSYRVWWPYSIFQVGSLCRQLIEHKRRGRGASFLNSIN